MLLVWSYFCGEVPFLALHPIFPGLVAGADLF
jgi:hypothetical protein